MHPSRQLLVTYALPYANGAIHLGHLVGFIQADIWVRFQRLQGNSCLFISGEDTHGTPIMLAAEKKGISPETLIAQVAEEHARDLQDFAIELDNYYTSHSPENKSLVDLIYHRMEAKNDIMKKTIEQAYDPKANIFLPDRYVKGSCPCCKTPDQYGDYCEACGSTYSPLNLIDPISVISGATPISKNSLHYFFKLSHYTDFLHAWISVDHLQVEVSNKLQEWFKEGLQDLDISRDTPYFGFTIPGCTDKYFYVWIDAPIAYLAIFKNLCTKNPRLNFEEYWGSDSAAEVYHFIGKDIINFHAVFWPAILKSGEFRTPTAVFAHGYLTVNGQKMSKSRGTFLNARDYLQHLDGEYLRYYFANKLNSKIEDLDLNLDDFAQRVNADLVGKVINIASRCASFINQRFDNKLAGKNSEPTLIEEFIGVGSEIADFYESREYSRAVRKIMELADRANQYINEKKPWKVIKESNQEVLAQEICTVGLNLFRILIIYLAPILPNTAKKVASFFNDEFTHWEDRKRILLGTAIQTFLPLLNRITEDSLTSLRMSNLSN